MKEIRVNHNRTNTKKLHEYEEIAKLFDSIEDIDHSIDIANNWVESTQNKKFIVKLLGNYKKIVKQNEKAKKILYKARKQARKVLKFYDKTLGVKFEDKPTVVLSPQAYEYLKALYESEGAIVENSRFKSYRHYRQQIKLKMPYLTKHIKIEYGQGTKLIL